MNRLIDLFVKIMERFLSTPIPQEHTVLTEPEPVQTDEELAADPYESVTAWCYVCRQGLGTDHDVRDLGCTYAPEE